MTFQEKMKGVRKPGSKRKEPLWKGPEEDGITFSMLSRFLVCRERFRISTIEGLRPTDGFNHRIEYGQMWHVCEEALAARGIWEECLKDYAHSIARQYPMQQEQVEKWRRVCAIQFPLYMTFWSKHPDVQKRTPLLQESVFDVPYDLPSGRVVRLRGKWDSVDSVGKGIWLQENKTKGDVNLLQLQRQLKFDLQTMMYVTALTHDTGIAELEAAKQRSGVGKTLSQKGASAIKGVRYNVVRRPLSGGKGSIKQTKNETLDQYYNRLGQYIVDEPETYFMRWNTEITPEDVTKFRTTCLDPLLEQVCDWYDWVGTLDQEPFDTKGSGGVHWRHPFGVFNVMDEGGSTDLDEYLETGNEVGLTRVDKLFAELEG